MTMYDELERDLEITLADLEELKEKAKNLENELKSYFWTTEEILGPWEYVPNFNTGTSEAFPAIVFDHGLYIEINEDGYYLLIENEDWISQSLEELMGYLADYRVESGLGVWARDGGGVVDLNS